ncbi:MAG: TonB-dependent receptor [Flavobacteriia bacterium]
MNKFILLLLFIPLFSFAQINGVVLDADSKQPVIGAKIQASSGERAISDLDGKFKLDISVFPVTLVTVMPSFLNDTVAVNASGDVTITLEVPIKLISDIVVSAGRRQQNIEDVPISMEILKPQLIDNKGVTDLEQAVEQSPGVFTMDGQVSIRGGSGFAYGTGSRVLVLWNGMPLLSGYAGDTQWNAIPMEQASQIEIMKGASSVLYGSGALNGVIALTEKEPNLKPETKIKVQLGVYDDPQRSSLVWWSAANNSAVRPAAGRPLSQMAEAYHGRMMKRGGYTISTALFHNDGYREAEFENRGRISGTIYFRFKKIDKLKSGIGYNYQFQRTGSFLIWQNDTFAYSPSGGVYSKPGFFGSYVPVDADSSSTVSYNSGQRLFIDPYAKYIDKFGNRHSLKTRVYFARNENLSNTAQSNQAVIYYADYSFLRQFGKNSTLTTGLTGIGNVVISNLFGDHDSENYAFYLQYEQKIGNRLDLTGGVRMEYFEMDGKRGDTDYIINKEKGTTIPVYPVFRGAVHYELAKYTHFRASIGQGIRYPSVAERFVQTNVGALNIFPNPGVRPEKGWAAEIGFKQGIKLGNDWKGMLDVAGFINEYENMAEFTFGLYNPPGVAPTLDWLGFQSQNTEAARITGFEFSFNSGGKIGGVEIISLIGYTYMNPVSLNSDSVYIYGITGIGGFSDTSTRMLKYRFNHLAKADIEVNYKKFSFGISGRYNSYMKNIDGVFMQDLDPTPEELYILPGLKAYREKYKKGNLVFDARIGYKITDQYRVGVIINNMLNAEYATRPGDIQPPRNFLLQLQMKF